MNHSRHSRTRTLALGGAGAVLLALALADSASAAPHRYEGREQRVERHAPSAFLHAVHRLGLTPEQRQAVRALVHTARQERRAHGHPPSGDWQALANPGDPRHEAAVKAAQARAAERVQRRSELEGRVYALLTPEQKAALPAVLAQMQNRSQRHHDRHWGRHESAWPA